MYSVFWYLRSGRRRWHRCVWWGKGGCPRTGLAPSSHRWCPGAAWYLLSCWQSSWANSAAKHKQTNNTSFRHINKSGLRTWAKESLSSRRPWLFCQFLQYGAGVEISDWFCATRPRFLSSDYTLSPTSSECKYEKWMLSVSLASFFHIQHRQCTCSMLEWRQ